MSMPVKPNKQTPSPALMTSKMVQTTTRVRHLGSIKTTEERTVRSGQRELHAGQGDNEVGL
jgi:hypothetical protein